MPGPGSPTSTDPHTMTGAFLTENPYARLAVHSLSKDVVNTADCAQGNAFATLALAYEQRQTRFDLLGIARGEL